MDIYLKSEGMKFYVNDAWIRNCFEITPYRYNSDGTVDVFSFDGQGWVFKKFDRGEVMFDDETKPLTIPKPWAKELITELLRFIDPPGPTATEQELKAVKFHLEDMRLLFFQREGVDISIMPKKEEVKNG